jgi:ACT domain-containing protein
VEAIITVVGKDAVGITAKVSQVLQATNVNILNISQISMDDTFTMMMKVDLSEMNCRRTELTATLDKLGQEESLVISVIHEDVLQAMHRI